MKGRGLVEIPYEGNEITRAGRRKIDDDINVLELRIQSLKTRRNEFSPISILPSELLSKIFILLRNLYGPIYLERPRWVRVGFVCHHWREVALGCPSLWSVPIFAKPDMAQEMINRSKMAALTIESEANDWTPRIQELLQHAMSQISRIQSIEFVLERRSQKIDAVLSPLSQPVPLLERASFSTIDWNTNRWFWPVNALSDAPRLRRVDFSSFGFSWKSAIFKNRNLTTLQLRDKRVVSGDDCTMGQMIDALGHLPNLRVLELNRSIPPHTTANGEEKTLEFEFLERLELTAMPAPDCIFFLRHIQYPSTAFVLLHCSPTRVGDCSTILSLVGLNLHRAQSVETGTLQLPTTIRSARLESSGADTAWAMFFDNTKGYASSSNEYFIPGPIIDIRFDDIEDIGGGYKSNHFFTNICNSFDLSTLEFLYINWNFSPLQTQEIRNTLGELPKLELIHVAQHLPAVCLAISESSEDLAEEAGEVEYQHGREQQYILPPTAVFPALKTLVISKVDFWKYRHPERLDYVTDVLMKRANMDLPIERLWIKRCGGLQIWQMRLLREFARLNKLGWPICDLF